MSAKKSLRGMLSYLLLKTKGVDNLYKAPAISLRGMTALGLIAAM